MVLLWIAVMRKKKHQVKERTLVAAGFAVIAPDLAGYANFGAAGNPPSAYASAADVGVAVAGAYAYVANEGHGLRVIDVSDPAAPVGVGS